MNVRKDLPENLSGLDSLMSSKESFKPKSIKVDREENVYSPKWKKIHLDYLSVFKIFALNSRAPIFIKERLLKLISNIDPPHTWVVKDFSNMPLTIGQALHINTKH